MRGALTYLVAILQFSAIQFSQCQTVAEVSTPELSLVDNQLQIHYHILQSTSSDAFSIRVEITNSEGIILPAKTFSGDIGEHIPGGNDKIILWDFETDSLFPEGNIYVQIIAIPETPEHVEEISPEKEKSFSRSSLMLQSLAFPGLGLSRIHPGRPHWIKGIAAYGCLGGAVYLNRKAITNYDRYIDSDNSADFDAYYTSSVQQDKASEILGFTALGIWVVDLVWTMVATNTSNTAHLGKPKKGIYMGSGFDTISSAPLLAFGYRF